MRAAHAMLAKGLCGRGIHASTSRVFTNASRPPRLLSAVYANVFYATKVRKWTWTIVIRGERREICCSTALRAKAKEAEEADDDEMALQWSDSFDNKLKMLTMEANALERELCENPTHERQSAIGKTLARSSRARALGGELSALYGELKGLQEVANDFKEDPGTREAFRNEALQVEQRIQHLQAELIVELLPRDLDDDLGVVLEVRAAAGGSEASLFAAEVFEMYHKYALRRGWTFEIMSTSPSEAGGVKEACAVVKGEKVYGHLKFESGVHRVQRVPITEGAGRVHTSTVSVAAMPDAPPSEFQVNERDIRIEVMRASGAGGQSVNTTESAVRMTHIPTGVTVKCADERSQHKNRAKALTILTARLYDKHKLDLQQAESAERKALMGSGDRSERIRTFNYAQDRITDHRVNSSVFGVLSFLDGEDLIDSLIDKLKRADAALRLQQMN